MVKLFLLVCLVLITGCASPPQPKIPKADGFYAKVFGPGLIITHSDGGLVKNFISAAVEVSVKVYHVKVDGDCMSSCAIFADKARPNVCITPRARFGFHMMRDSENRSVILGPMQMSKDIDRWVNANGGYPSSNLDVEALIMDAKEAAAFWPMCK